MELRLNTLKMINMTDELLEPMADMEHEQWIHWMKYFVEKGDPQLVEQGRFHTVNPRNDDVVVLVFKAEDWNRWKRQMATQYHDLSEKEKNSDRNQAKKMIDYLDQIGRLL